MVVAADVYAFEAIDEIINDDDDIAVEFKDGDAIVVKFITG